MKRAAFFHRVGAGLISERRAQDDRFWNDAEDVVLTLESFPPHRHPRRRLYAMSI